MTITYQHDVSSGSFRGFTRLLFKWRGSVYKLIYKELFVFGLAYSAVSISYRTALNADQRHKFEMISMYCSKYIDMIPLSFVLGFYVTFVVQRWWTQFISIPWPDRLMNTVILYVDGSDDRGRFLRRTLMRYWNLSFVLMMAAVSPAVKKRFPTLEHIVRAGFMTEDEFDIYNSIECDLYKGWIPMNWFINILAQARKEGRTKSGASLKHVLEELNDFRHNLRLLWCHDWVTLPLVYTQVVTWATHLFFVISLIGRQFLDTTKGYRGHEVDLYVPFFTIIQFLFYMGWLKVAEQLINPFGQDDDDVECNWLIDRHLQVSYLGVDEVCNKMPIIPSGVPWIQDQPLTETKEPEDNITQFHVLGQCFPDGSDSPKAPSFGGLNRLTPVFRKLRERDSPPGVATITTTTPTKRFRTLGNRKYLLSEKSLIALNTGCRVGHFRNGSRVGSGRDHWNGSTSSECVVQMEVGDPLGDPLGDALSASSRSEHEAIAYTNNAFLSDNGSVRRDNRINQSRSLPSRTVPDDRETGPVKTLSTSSSFPRGDASVRINVEQLESNS